MKSSNKILAIAALALFTACSVFTSYQNEQNKADALLAKQDSLQQVFNNIDIEKITEIGQTTLGELDSILAMVKDKNLVLEKDDAIFLGRYKSLSKPYRKLNETRDFIVYDLNLSKKQLSALSKDIANKSIPKDSVNIFLNEEEQALKLVANNIEALKSSKNSVEKEYEQSQDEIKRIFMEIEAK